MLWTGLSGSVDAVYRKWLASTISLCVPCLSRDTQEAWHDDNDVDDDRRERERSLVFQQYDGEKRPIITSTPRDALSGGGGGGGAAAEKVLEACHDQPGLVAPLRPAPRHQRSGSQSSTLTSKWMARSRSLVTRASSHGSLLMSRTSVVGRPRRPTISAPSDFRRVLSDYGTDAQRFRPLELSIYQAHNRLSALPVFDSSRPSDNATADKSAEESTIDPLRASSVLSWPSSDFRIARKPIGSSPDLKWLARTQPTGDASPSPSLMGSEWVVQPLRPRPSLPLALNTPDRVSTPHRHLPSLPPTAHTHQSGDSYRWLGTRDGDPLASRPRPRSERDILGRGPVAGHTAELSDFDDNSAFGVGHSGHSAYQRTSVLNRPHPLKSLASLPLLSDPSSSYIISSTPARQRAPSDMRKSQSQPRLSRWAFPPADVSTTAAADQHQHQQSPLRAHEAYVSRPDPSTPLSSAGAATAGLFKNSPRTRSSTLSTLGTAAWDDPLTPPAVTPHASPGRPSPLRQRTFGYGEAVTLNTVTSAPAPTKPVQVEEVRVHDEQPTWPTEGGEHDDVGSPVVSIDDAYPTTPMPYSPVGVAF